MFGRIGLSATHHNKQHLPAIPRGTPKWLRLFVAYRIARREIQRRRYDARQSALHGKVIPEYRLTRPTPPQALQTPTWV